MRLTFVVAVAVLIGLFLFLLNEVRRSPGPIEWGRTPRWSKRIRIGLATLLLVFGLMGFWAFLVEPNRLVTRQERIHINDWPRDLSGIRIAVLSDIHAGAAFIDDRKLHLIVERTNKLNPDLIVIAGDYMSGNDRTSERVEPEVFSAILKDLRAPLGVYSVLGNHDWWYNGKRVKDRLEANGIKVIDEQTVEIKIRNSSFWLVGFADLWTRPQRIEQTLARVHGEQPIIALTHNPDIFPRVPQRVSLLLAGHTHGGQVRFPIIGTLIQPSEYGQRYVRGHVVENGHHLFVTTGIGTSIVPVRFLVPPEIVLLTIE